jgi:hypothetical protein
MLRLEAVSKQPHAWWAEHSLANFNDHFEIDEQQQLAAKVHARTLL